MALHQCQTTYSDTIWPSTSLPLSFSFFVTYLYICPSHGLMSLFCLYVPPSRQLLHHNEEEDPSQAEVNIQHLCLWDCTQTFTKVQFSWNNSGLHAFQGQGHTVSRRDTLSISVVSNYRFDTTWLKEYTFPSILRTNTASILSNIAISVYISWVWQPASRPSSQVYLFTTCILQAWLADGCYGQLNSLQWFFYVSLIISSMCIWQYSVASHNILHFTISCLYLIINAFQQNYIIQLISEFYHLSVLLNFYTLINVFKSIPNNRYFALSGASFCRDQSNSLTHKISDLIEDI